MALNVVMVAEKQSPKGLCLTWNPMEGVASYLVLVANRRLTPEELGAAVESNGSADCAVVKVAAEVTSVVDDASAQGDSAFYGVAMTFNQGEPRPARLRIVPDGGSAETVTLSSLGVKKQAAKPVAAAATAAPAAGLRAPPSTTGSYKVGNANSPTLPSANSGAYRVGTAGASAAPSASSSASASPSASPSANTGAYRVAAASGSAAPSASPSSNTGAYRVGAAAAEPVASPAANTGMYRVGAAAASPQANSTTGFRIAKPAAAAVRPLRDPDNEIDPNAPVAPPAEVPLAEKVEFRMSGGTQTWDGLRLYWEREPNAAAYEVLVSDHQIFPDELGDALLGKGDFISCVAVNPRVTVVIDNVTPREARGWYLVLARMKDGTRAPHPFKVGDAAESGKTSAPFVNPNRTGELRAEVDGMLSDAREQWQRWKNEQDGGARHEAKRLLRDAQLMFPDYPSAKTLAEEMG